jgi:DNA-directed RNA polymerase subunit F
MRKTKKRPQEYSEEIESFSQVFDSMEDELLVEMACFYPQQLRDLCIFLTLDRQMAEEELQHKLVAYLD